jgi:hypothetical protein
MQGRELWAVTTSIDRIGFNRACFCEDTGQCVVCQFETLIYGQFGFKGLNFFRGLLNGTFGKECDKCGKMLAPCEINKRQEKPPNTAVLRKRPK